MKKKKLHLCAASHACQHRCNKKDKRMTRQAIAMTDEMAGQWPVWPSLSQLRERLLGRVRSQPDCPYRFDQAI